MDKVNLSIIRQSFANTVFTHQVQEIAAAAKRKAILYIKIANIIITGIVLVLLVLQSLYQNVRIYGFIGAGLTVGEILFLIIQLTFDFEQQSLLHKNSALKYMALRDQYRSLIADVMNEKIAKKEIILRRDALQREYQSISDMSPPTGSAEYAEAQKRLNAHGDEENPEQFTWSDIEIDQFLPEELRIASQE